jgi:hypothetical protein
MAGIQQDYDAIGIGMLTYSFCKRVKKKQFSISISTI